MAFKYKIGNNVLVIKGDCKGYIGKIIAINEYSINCYSILLYNGTSIQKSEDEIEEYKKYEDGLNDAWQAACKIVVMPTNKLNKMFSDHGHISNLFNSITPQEAIKRISEHEDNKNITWIGRRVM